MSRGKRWALKSCSVLVIVIVISPLCMSGGKKGGTSCTHLGIPANITEINPPLSGGNEMNARLLNYGGSSVVFAAVGYVWPLGSTTSVVDLYLLDPSSGLQHDSSLGFCNGESKTSVNLPWTANGYIRIGDFNNDGLPDIVLAGAQFQDAYVILAHDTGSCVTYDDYPSAYTFKLVPSEQVGTFAYSVAVGDLDGSPGDEIAIGSEAAGKGASFVKGKVSLFKISGTSTPSYSNYLTITDPQSSPSTDGFGRAVAIGDVVGNSNNDLLVGAPFTSAGGYSQAGTVLIFSGQPLSLSETLAGTRKNDEIGAKLAVGYITGSSKADIVATTGLDSTDAKAIVYKDLTAYRTLPLSLTNSTGESGAFATGLDLGDLNGDQLADVLIGASQSSLGPGCGTPGAAYLYTTDGMGFQDSIIQPTDTTGEYGWRVSTVPGTQLFLIVDKPGFTRLYKLDQ